MNLLTFIRVQRFIKIVLVLTAFFSSVSVKAWEVDFSRRKKDTKEQEATLSRGPASVPDGDSVQDVTPPSSTKKNPKLIEDIFRGSEPTQEIVILNTEKGFVPETVRLRKDGNYKITVVNVNEKEKNVSFILDAFSEHHGTYYGSMKTFEIKPKAEGVFSYMCPETAAQGRFVIYSNGTADDATPTRVPASN